MLGGLDDLLEVSVTIFEDQVLGGFAVLASGIVNFEHSDDVPAVLKSRKDLELPRNVFAGLLGALDGDGLFAFSVECFKNVA